MFSIGKPIFCSRSAYRSCRRKGSKIGNTSRKTSQLLALFVGSFEPLPGVFFLPEAHIDGGDEEGGDVGVLGGAQEVVEDLSGAVFVAVLGQTVAEQAP